MSELSLAYSEASIFRSVRVSSASSSLLSDSQHCAMSLWPIIVYVGMLSISLHLRAPMHPARSLSRHILRFLNLYSSVASCIGEGELLPSAMALWPYDLRAMASNTPSTMWTVSFGS